MSKISLQAISKEMRRFIDAKIIELLEKAEEPIIG